MEAFGVKESTREAVVAEEEEVEEEESLETMMTNMKVRWGRSKEWRKGRRGNVGSGGGRAAS